MRKILAATSILLLTIIFLAQEASATIQMTVNGSSNPVTVASGAALTVALSGGPGNPGDWLGVYAVGSQSGPGDPASWKWLSTDDMRGSIPPSGVTTGTVHLVAPAQAGQYEVRFFPNSGFAVAATSATITVSAGTTTLQVNGSANPITVSGGATITATVAGGPGNPGDWLGVYAVGAPNSNYSSWRWLSTDDGRGSVPPSGITAGTVHLVVPVQAGQYEVRFFLNNSFTLAATSATITVSAGTTTLQVNGSANPITVSGGATITATVAGGPGNPGDWLGVYAVGAPNNNYSSWRWLSTDDGRGSVPPSGITAGTVHLVVPVQAGQYEVRFFLNNSFTLAATSATITVANASSATVQVNGSSSPITVSSGASITATVTDGPGNPGDWLGVYLIGSASGPGDPASWKWLSTDDARGSIPPSGVTSGTVHLVVPAQAGQYEVRFFSNSSFTVVAVSAAITVSQSVGDDTILPTPPAGYHWVQTFGEEFNSTFANRGTASASVTLDTSHWQVDHYCGQANFTTFASPTYGCGLSNTASDTVSGGILTMTVQASPAVRNIIDTAYTANPGTSNQPITPFQQRYGYFVYDAKLPTCASSEFDLESFGSTGPSVFSSGTYSELGWVSQVGGSCHYGNLRAYQGDQNGNFHFFPDANLGDITTAFHQYGLFWVNDATAHGSVTVYYDGTPETGSPIALISPGFDSGIYFDIYWDPCVQCEGGAGIDPQGSTMQFDWIRAYQLVPN